jgi:site-specific DNA recombinase
MHIITKCLLARFVLLPLAVTEEGESLDEQTNRLKAFCVSRGWKVNGVYREEGFSGKDLKRPEFQRMMADIHKGRINSVVVKKIDRLSRSIIDF